MSKPAIIAILTGLYMFGFFQTYGLTANSEYNRCLTVYGQNFLIDCDTQAVRNSFFTSVIWPLYWPMHLSRKAFSNE